MIDYNDEIDKNWMRRLEHQLSEDRKAQARADRVERIVMTLLWGAGLTLLLAAAYWLGTMKRVHPVSLTITVPGGAVASPTVEATPEPEPSAFGTIPDALEAMLRDTERRIVPLPTVNSSSKARPVQPGPHLAHTPKKEVGFDPLKRGSANVSAGVTPRRAYRRGDEGQQAFEDAAAWKSGEDYDRNREGLVRGADRWRGCDLVSVAKAFECRGRSEHDSQADYRQGPIPLPGASGWSIQRLRNEAPVQVEGGHARLSKATDSSASISGDKKGACGPGSLALRTSERQGTEGRVGTSLACSEQLKPGRHLRALAIRQAGRCKVPVALALTLVGRESSWNPLAVSSAGAVGLAQVRPYHSGPLLDVRDPETNLSLGFCLLRRHFDRLKGWNLDDARAWRLALEAYHGGQYRVRTASVTRRYATDIVRGSAQ